MNALNVSINWQIYVHWVVSYDIYLNNVELGFLVMLKRIKYLQLHMEKTCSQWVIKVFNSVALFAHCS